MTRPQNVALYYSLHFKEIAWYLGDKSWSTKVVTHLLIVNVTFKIKGFEKCYAVATITKVWILFHLFHVCGLVPMGTRQIFNLRVSKKNKKHHYAWGLHLGTPCALIQMFKWINNRTNFRMVPWFPKKINIENVCALIQLVKIQWCSKLYCSF